MSFKNILFYFLPPILWAVFILAICLMPSREIPSFSLFEADKPVHIAVYFILSFLSFRAFSKSAVHISMPNSLALLTVIVGYGFFVELAQEALTADRHFDIWDAVANTLGVVLFIILKQLR